MSATRLTRLELAVLRNVWRGLLPHDARTEAGRLATFTGCAGALARLRRYGFVDLGCRQVTAEGYLAMVGRGVRQ